MLAFFRSLSKSKIFWVVLGLPLVAGLLVFGNVGDVFKSVTGEDAVVSAGDRTVSSTEFKQYFDNARKDFEQRAGRSITPEEAASQGAVNGLLQSLASREALMAALTKAGIRPSDKLLIQQIQKIPAFFNPVTGQFDAEAYKQRLADEGLTPERFEAASKDELATDHFRLGMAGGLKAPMIYAALAASAQLEQRTFSAFSIDPATIPPPAPPTDAELQAFVERNKARLTLPERRSLTVVRFSARAIEPSVTVDPAEVRARYDFRKDTLATPERRTIVQIPARDAASAAAAAARLGRGEAPAAVAKSLGVEPINYADSPRTAISDPAIAQAAFSLPAGAVSQPIRGSLGFAVVKVLSITPGKAVSFEEARPPIEAELRTLVAQDRIEKLVEAYEKAHDTGASLKESAKAAGVTALELPPVTARGVNQQGQQAPMLSEKLLKDAFELPEGGESEVASDGKGEYYAVRVEKVFPPAVPPLAEARNDFVALYISEQRSKALKARMDALSERVRKGETMDAVAASVGARLNRQTVDLRSAERSQDQMRQILSAVFSAKPGEIIPAGAGLIRVESVKPGSITEAALMTRAGEQSLRMALFQDMSGEAGRWATGAFKAKTDPAKARAAIGLQPAEAAAPAPGAAK
jgi:peptidyl-prolyl cis-trans isomerase D